MTESVSRTKQSKLDLLAAEIAASDITPQLADGATQLVMGVGNPDADVVFIGEAPGKKEDETGVPFVGASGRFLDEMLATAGLAREDVYITNIVKYRPPGNRDPTTAEKEAFLPYLQAQLEIIQPRVVMTLGRHAGGAFIDELVISKDHGVARDVIFGSMKLTVVPLYHPAAALYNGTMRPILLSDFAQAAQNIRLS